MRVPGAPESFAASTTIAYVLADLAIILIAARIVGGVFARYGQPRVVGEIIAGILIGPTVLGGQLAKGAVTALDKPAVDGSGLVNDLYPLQAFAFLNLIGSLALIFFMFLVGLEVQQRFLRGRERQILIVAGAVLLVPIGLGFVVGAILDEPGKWKVAVTDQGIAVSATTHALFLGAALAVTAFPVMARILQEKRQLGSPMGGIGVGAAAVVTPLMFLVLAGASASAKGEGVPEHDRRQARPRHRPLVAAAVRRRAARRCVVLDPASLQGGRATRRRAVRAAADRRGAHRARRRPDRDPLPQRRVPVRCRACRRSPGLGKAVIDRLQQFVVVFLIPIFLAVSGLQTDLTVLGTEHIVGIAIFVVAMIAGKWFVGAGAGMAVGLSFKEANAIGVLMNCRGLMILVVALVGKQAGVITDPMQGAFVIGAIVTTLMTGPLVDVFLPKSAVEEKRKETMAGSIAGMPAMSGGPRILVVPGIR